MNQKEPGFSRKLPAIPKGLPRRLRNLFVSIVHEMVDAGVDVQPVDSFTIGRLADNLAFVRELGKTGPGGTFWKTACNLGRELQLSDHAMKRLLNEPAKSARRRARSK